MPVCVSVELKIHAGLVKVCLRNMKFNEGLADLNAVKLEIQWRSSGLSCCGT